MFESMRYAGRCMHSESAARESGGDPCSRFFFFSSLFSFGHGTLLERRKAAKGT